MCPCRPDQRHSGATLGTQWLELRAPAEGGTLDMPLSSTWPRRRWPSRPVAAPTPTLAPEHCTVSSNSPVCRIRAIRGASGSWLRSVTVRPSMCRRWACVSSSEPNPAGRPSRFEDIGRSPGRRAAHVRRRPRSSCTAPAIGPTQHPNAAAFGITYGVTICLDGDQAFGVVGRRCGIGRRTGGQAGWRVIQRLALERSREATSRPSGLARCGGLGRGDGLVERRGAGGR
jgi:hypothetical protein